MAYRIERAVRGSGWHGTIAMQVKGRWTMDKVTIEGIKMSHAAAERVEETGCSPADDLAGIRSGRWTRTTLLDHCIDGADRDRHAGWREYVDAIVEATE